jgi:hypothetical protein
VKKSESGDVDIWELLIVSILLVGLLFGVGPCNKCFYRAGEQAPFQVKEK